MQNITKNLDFANDNTTLYLMVKLEKVYLSCKDPTQLIAATTYGQLVRRAVKRAGESTRLISSLEKFLILRKQIEFHVQ